MATIATRGSETNPFLPGSDLVPEVWAGRTAELADFDRTVVVRRSAGLYERGRTILGEPGIGKSVLARRIMRDAGHAGHLVLPSIRVPRGSDPLALLADAVIAAVEGRSLGERVASRAAGLLDRVRDVRLGVTVTLGDAASVQPHVTLRDALITLASIAADDEKVLVLHVDEVQNVRAPATLSQLLIAIGDALGHEVDRTDAAGNIHTRVLPLVVYLSGLRDFTERATSAAGATFARRFKPLILSYLTETEIRTALAPFTAEGWPVLTESPGRVTMTADAVTAIVNRCLGDPFLFQLLGAAAWTQGEGATITADEVRRGWDAVRPEATGHVERVWSRVPAGEQALFDSLVGLSPEQRHLSDAAEALGRSSAELAQTARRLEDRGLIRRGRPYVVLAAPLEAHLTGTWD